MDDLSEEPRKWAEAAGLIVKWGPRICAALIGGAVVWGITSYNKTPAQVDPEPVTVTETVTNTVKSTVYVKPSKETIAATELLSQVELKEFYKDVAKIFSGLTEQERNARMMSIAEVLQPLFQETVEKNLDIIVERSKKLEEYRRVLGIKGKKTVEPDGLGI